MEAIKRGRDGAGTQFKQLDSSCSALIFSCRPRSAHSFLQESLLGVTGEKDG